MYIENVKNAIKHMTEEQYSDFIEKLKSHVLSNFDANPRPSIIEEQVRKFANDPEKVISLRYFEAYLLILDQVSVDGDIRGGFGLEIQQLKSRIQEVKGGYIY
ncbi:hypothetical protein D1B33_13360 [Lysinibacillus yapensis]|uniref:Uncharacterized protein n=1 Tax=Ureibacillus yapensis TaxID=2304605 RepID=A0A396S5H5_9BACL|nr:hypothetical protein [Lysinibacillus yapensis]RHW35025.1 hypothetical protein D1B33_13360 [Lysinibacillus yapensis]